MTARPPQGRSRSAPVMLEGEFEHEEELIQAFRDDESGRMGEITRTAAHV